MNKPLLLSRGAHAFRAEAVRAFRHRLGRLEGRLTAHQLLIARIYAALASSADETPPREWARGQFQDMADEVAKHDHSVSGDDDDGQLAALICEGAHQELREVLKSTLALMEDQDGGQ